MAEHAYILPPSSKMGQADESEVEKAIKVSDLFIKYNTPSDPESAYEFLERQKIQEANEEVQAKEAAKAQKELEKAQAKQAKEIQRSIKSVGSTAAGTVGREIGNALGGAFGKFGKKLGGNVGASLARNLFGTLFKR